MSARHLTTPAFLGRTLAQLLLTATVCGGSTEFAAAQYQGVPGVHHPLNQASRPGMAAQWSVIVRPPVPDAMQFVRLTMEVPGRVEVYDRASGGFVPQPDQAPLRLAVGHIYRFKLSEMPDRPGTELYPTVELLDRLHPPPGRESEFPVPIDIEQTDIRRAAGDQLVTRVVYLEQPQLASPLSASDLRRAVTIPGWRNALAEADLLGRPLAIVRIGGRRAPSHTSNPGFFGSGGQVVVPAAQDSEETIKIGDWTATESDPSGTALVTSGTPSAIVQTAATSAGRAARPDGWMIHSSAAIPRVKLAEHTQQTERPTPEVVTSAPWVADFPDEFLFDGGDRNTPVHYDGHHRLGLDTEDTVAEYVDHLGDEHVRASNRIAVFAPRFGSIRTITGAQADFSVDRVAGTHKNVHGGHLRLRQTPLDHARDAQVGGLRVRARASGLENADKTDGIRALTSLAGTQRKFDPRQTVLFLAGSQFEQADEPWLAGSIRNAIVWTRDQYPQISAALAGAGEVHATFTAAEHVGVEDRHKTRGHLVITKLADRETALPGDIITFTIRYENIGDRSLHNIRIVDNLTPRLEFIPDSGASDRPGNVVFESNSEGSMVLRFDLDDPLSGRLEDGSSVGVLTFQARVK